MLLWAYILSLKKLHISSPVNPHVAVSPIVHVVTVLREDSWMSLDTEVGWMVVLLISVLGPDVLIVILPSNITFAFLAQMLSGSEQIIKFSLVWNLNLEKTYLSFSSHHLIIYTCVKLSKTSNCIYYNNSELALQLSRDIDLFLACHKTQRFQLVVWCLSQYYSRFLDVHHLLKKHIIVLWWVIIIFTVKYINTYDLYTLSLISYNVGWTSLHFRWVKVTKDRWYDCRHYWYYSCTCAGLSLCSWWFVCFIYS